MISLKSHRLKATATSLRALRKSSRIAPFPASRRLHLRVWKSIQLPSANEGERRGERAIEEEEDMRDGGRSGEREREREKVVACGGIRQGGVDVERELRRAP